MRKKTSADIGLLKNGAAEYIGKIEAEQREIAEREAAERERIREATERGIRFQLRETRKPEEEPDKYDRDELSRIFSLFPRSSEGIMRSAALEKAINASFGKTLLRYVNESGVRPSKIYKAACVDRRLYSHITTNPGYQPSKDTCIAFALALRLNEEQTKDLLSRAGYTLSHSIKRDVIIEYLIISGVYDLITVNTVLDRFGEKIIGRE